MHWFALRGQIILINPILNCVSMHIFKTTQIIFFEKKSMPKMSCTQNNNACKMPKPLPQIGHGWACWENDSATNTTGHCHVWILTDWPWHGTEMPIAARPSKGALNTQFVRVPSLLYGLGRKFRDLFLAYSELAQIILKMPK